MEKLNRLLPDLGQFEQVAGADGMQVASSNPPLYYFPLLLDNHSDITIQRCKSK
jgi:hypothetical protein